MTQVRFEVRNFRNKNFVLKQFVFFFFSLLPFYLLLRSKMSDKKETKQEERQWEELYLIFQFLVAFLFISFSLLFHRDSIPIDLFDEKNPTIKPNTRTYLDPVHADGISWWDEVKAMFISFSFVGIFYYFIILFIIGYYSKFARSILLGNAFLGNSLHVIVILDLVDSCKAS